MTDIIIKYQEDSGKGIMTVHLEEFLSCRSISNVRKLMKLINQYGDGSEVQKILNIIEQFKDSYEVDQKLNASKIVGYTDKIKFTDRQIQNLVSNRSRFKKGSDSWKHYNKLVEEQREELRSLKTSLFTAKSDFNNNERLKKFYDSCSKVMQG